MDCERCLSNAPVERHEVDGYRGFLCAQCRETWNRLTDDRRER